MTGLFPYQDEGARWLATRERAGLHDEMGLGKTAQAIRAFNLIDGKRGLVVCPAKLRDNWLREFRKWSLEPLRVIKGADLYDFTAWDRGRHNVLVTSYEQATKWAESIYNAGEIIDAVVLDEGHYVKNTESKRTKAILGNHMDGTGGMIAWAEHTWHLTGTPIANDPKDLYPFLRMCQVMPLSEGMFTRRYFYADRSLWGTRQALRYEMVGELQALLDNNHIQRTKAGVGLQLPPIFLQSVVVDGDQAPILMLLAQYPGLEAAIMQAVHAGSLSFIDSVHVMQLRRLLGEAKSIPYGYVVADEIKQTGQKRLIFGRHIRALRNVYDILAFHRIPVVLAVGEGMTDKQVQASFDAFQNEPNVLALVANMQVGGVGQTFTACNEIDLLESDWTPAGNKQAIDRIHRIGQHRNVFVRFITLANSFDERVNEIVAGKVSSILAIEGPGSWARNATVMPEDVTVAMRELV